MDTMEGLLREPDRPLSIVVTDAGSEVLKMRSLAREAIPMLLRPETHSLLQRSRIAEGFKEVLYGACDAESDSDEESIFSEIADFAEDNEYEPGEALHWPEKEWD